ncbi:hypothetical protein GN958_ATG00085 [Phytophthora infestans]|uniref:Uncharacterized protein n=1 Tax=Phytophthora infestans TaxID=4787 RepID=A0A8S9VCI0_PHYIN|nr:hypothetical protein GN958_ATG00085 [Phytophthora infestans]
MYGNGDDKLPFGSVVGLTAHNVSKERFTELVETHSLTVSYGTYQSTAEHVNSSPHLRAMHHQIARALIRKTITTTSSDLHSKSRE